MTESPSRPLINGQTVVGSILLMSGFALLLEARTNIRIDFWSSGWTVLLFTVGLIRFIDPRVGDGECPSRRTGAWLMTVGAWGFISMNKLFGLTFQTSWSLLIVAAGILTVWWAIDESRKPAVSRKVD